MESTDEHNLTTAAEVEPVSTSVSETPESPLERLRRWLMPTPVEQAKQYQARLEQLDNAIAHHPEAVSNYVVRGELHLEAGMVDLAVMDFQRAVELGAQQFDSERWGIITQAMRERACDGLNRALRLRARERLHGKYSQNYHR
jgi:cytochrome c-type biogenesis protein CcmH/NrfG